MSQDHLQVASSAAIEHLRWAMTVEVGPILFGRIIERFGSAQAALGAPAAQLEHVDGIGSAKSSAIARGCEQADVRQEVELAAEHSVRILCRDDDAYPAPLRYIADPPICLYVRGQLEPEDTVAVGIVGARRCTIYGREQANRFGYLCASNGLTVVSGLARGVDGEAHKGAIAANGRTLAVLGNGLTDIYPPEHRQLADRVAQQGALISELPMTSSPQASNFLPRNRLIAGLSLGVLVIEAARRSGSLTTAKLASEYDREVFALPGRVDSDYSQGTNRLIRDQHAKCVTGIEDILNELGSAGEALGQAKTESSAEPNSAEASVSGLNEIERAVLGVIDHEEKTIETVAERTGQSTAKVAATLVGLQLRGLVRQLPGNLFVRVGRR